MLDAVEAMKNRSHLSIAAIASGGELFCRFITLSIGDKSIEECQRIMLERGNAFLKKLLDSRKCITKLAEKFIKDGCKVLTHSRSRVVLQTMIHAAENNKHFHVFVTEGGKSDDKSGKKMCEELEEAGIECTLILDSAVGYVMESVDFVMVGAEAVVESGGIINRIGSFTTAICAKDMKKPFYVLSESFKFTRLYPLNQRDLSDEYKVCVEINLLRSNHKILRIFSILGKTAGKMFRRFTRPLIIHHPLI